MRRAANGGGPRLGRRQRPGRPDAARDPDRSGGARAGEPSSGALLEPALLARLERLQLTTRRRLAGLYPGEHRSIRRGTSVDFADYRQYHPGDDFRRIDYNLYARLDVLAIKLFEAEDEARLRLLVDTSGSMGVGGKMEAAARVAAALGFVALTRRDPVTLHTFPLDRPAPRFVGRTAIPAFFDHLRRLEAEGETRFAAAAAHLLAQPGPPGLTVVLSDLLTPEWNQGIGRLPARGGDVLVVHVLAPHDLDPELAPDLAGDVELVDREDGRRLAVSLSPEMAARYREGAEVWAAEVAARCRRAGAAYLRMTSGDDIERLLLTTWREAGVVR
jgi:uncharacterized protein (DUF58 family)